MIASRNMSSNGGPTVYRRKTSWMNHELKHVNCYDDPSVHDESTSCDSDDDDADGHTNNDDSDDTDADDDGDSDDGMPHSHNFTM